MAGLQSFTQSMQIPNINPYQVNNIQMYSNSFGYPV